MLTPRISLHGLLLVLMALMAQLGVGASVPRLDPLAVPGAAAICHGMDDGGTAPDQAPGHPADCLVCPLCVALHAPAAVPVPVAVVVIPPPVIAETRPELPPPATAPPSYRWQPSQPRGPPVFS